MHTRYFLESAEVIRQVHGAKELTGMMTSRQQLDEVGQSARATSYGSEVALLVAHHRRAWGVYIV